MNCYSGQNYNIVPRLSKEGKSTDLLCLQFETEDSMKGIESWMPLSKEDFWPICPGVGDTFLMDSYFGEQTEHLTWKIVRRIIFTSGPAAQDMRGIVILVVERVLST